MPEKSTKESNQMGETKTIEERYEWLKQHPNIVGVRAQQLLDDLMAEREIVREQFADYDEMIRREKQRRNPEYQKSLPTVDDVVGILKED